LNTRSRPVSTDNRLWQRILSALPSGGRSPQEVYRLLAEQALSAARGSFCEIWLPGTGEWGWERAALAGSGPDGEEHRTPTVVEVLSACAATGRIQVWHERAARTPSGRAGRGLEWTELAVPLSLADRAEGVMVLGRAGGVFTHEDIAAAEAAAGLAAIILWALRVDRRAQDTERRLQALYEAAQILASTLDIDTILQRLGDVLERTFNYPYFAILLVDDEGYLVVRSAQGYADKVGLRIPFGQGITGLAAREGRPVVENDVAGNPAYIPGLPGARAEVAVPVHLRGDVAGVINVESRDRAFTGEDVALLMSLADLVAIALDNARLFGDVQKMAMTDALSGLVNYRYFNKYLQEAIESARLVAEPVSLLVIDLDNFKGVNDRLGHQAGDRVLAAFAALLRGIVRRSDTAARVGGDEFAVICRSTGREGAAALGARLAAGMADHVFGPYGDVTVRLSASMGVAAFPEDAESFEELWQRADAAMYQGKKRGGAVVQVYGSV